ILITGANGYLGRWVQESLKNSNSDTIYCLTRTGSLPQDTGPFRWFSGDLLDPSSFRQVLSRCDTVVHMAALTGKGSAREHFRVTAEGTRSLIQGCQHAGVRNFLHISTISAKFASLHHYHYGQAKRHAEEIVASSGLQYTIVRPTMIFGKDAPVLQGLLRMVR